MQNSFGEQKVFEEADYKFTVLNNDPEIVNKVREIIRNFPNPIEISEGGFSLLEGLLRITIPEGVKIIDDDAFNGCISLREITMPNTMKYIGNRVFDGCDKLERLQISESVLEEIGGVNNLYKKSNLNDNVSISISNIANMPNIPDKAFRDRTDVTQVIIPEGVLEIDVEAFAGCRNLKQATMPESLTKIGVGAFNSCSSLSQIYIPSNVNNIGALAFNACSNLKKVNIPNGVTSIANGVFCNCSSLEEVTIPNGVTSIGNWAFQNCSNLKEIIIPNSVNEIGFDAFSGCSNLTEVTIPNSVTKIGNGVFSDCRNLTEVTIPNSVTKIGNVVFSGCSNLQKINIPAHLFHEKLGGNVNSVREKLGLNSDVKIFVDGKELNSDINELKDKISGLLANLKEMVTSKSHIQSVAKNDIFEKSNSNLNVFDKLNAKKNSEKTKPLQTKESR